MMGVYFGEFYRREWHTRGFAKFDFSDENRIGWLAVHVFCCVRRSSVNLELLVQTSHADHEVRDLRRGGEWDEKIKMECPGIKWKVIHSVCCSLCRVKFRYLSQNNSQVLYQRLQCLNRVITVYQKLML